MARHAHAAGHTVSILQPLAVQRYAQATLSRNKTDCLDAALIADFGRTQEPRAWTPPRPVLRAQAARLAAKGKPGQVRVAAVMRKLLVLWVGVLRSGQPWNPTGRPTPKPSAPAS